MADAALGMALGMAIKEGEIIEVDADGSPTGPVAGLNYIIPPGNNNCGAGGPVDHDMDGGTDPVAPSVAGAIAKDVATGYSETLTAYLALRAEDATVKATSKALNDLLMDDIDDDIQTATIAAARETLLAAQTKQGAAQRALSAVGTGPINRLGIAEWQAKFAVEDAVTAWNTAVGGLMEAETALNPMDYAAYVPVTSTQLLALVDQNGDVNLANVRMYANAEGDNTSTQDAMTGVVTGASAFDAAGNLIVPMELWDHDEDGDTDRVLRPVAASMDYEAVNMRLEDVGDVVEALEKLQKDNKNALLTPAITEAVRRATAEQAHYEGQFAAMVADNTDTNPVNSDGDDENDGPVISLKSRYAEYTAAKTVRDNEGVELETAFQAREMATSAVAAAFTNPQAFYQQLVDRREHTKAQMEAEVTRLAGLTGDDAASDADTEAAAKAVTTAETALTAATDAQAAFQSLVAEGSPVADLVNELLKSDATGDDGGELVDAIVGAYDAPAKNEARLDALLKETETETETMTQVMDADGNPVLNEDGTPMMETTTTTTTTESGRIPSIENRIDELFGSDDDEDMEGEDATAGLIEGLREDVTGNDARLDALLAETTTTTDTTDADGNPVLDADGNPVTETTTTESGRIVNLEEQVAGEITAREGAIDDLFQTLEDGTETGRIVDGDAATLAAAGDAADAGDAATLATAGEAADAGDAATLAAAGEAADAGDAATLAAAGEAADAGDAATLAAAGEAADAGDAATLAAAGEAADAGDAATLAAAGEAADAGDAATLAAAGEAADAGDAATLAAAGEAADAGDAATLAAAGEAADAGDAAEASTRHAADMMLAGAITDEATARADADTAEATARADADTAEATTRHAADMMLAGAIDDEVADRAAGDTALGGRIDTNVEMIGTNVTNIAANATAIMAEQTARVEAGTMLGGRIDVEAMARMEGDAANAADIMTNAGNIATNGGRIDVNEMAIASNAGGIASNASLIGSNAAAIGVNETRIGELSNDLDIVRSGVAASMALAGMPHINGRGIAIGVGSFDGESAFAVGFQIQGEMASFQIGVTSSGGETGASAGVGFQF